MEMIALGENILGDVRYEKSFIMVWVLFSWTPIHMFPIDGGCIKGAFTC
jgi:hypothetical protein